VKTMGRLKENSLKQKKIYFGTGERIIVSDKEYDVEITDDADVKTVMKVRVISTKLRDGKIYISPINCRLLGLSVNDCSKIDLRYSEKIFDVLRLWRADRNDQGLHRLGKPIPRSGIVSTGIDTCCSDKALSTKVLVSNNDDTTVDNCTDVEKDDNENGKNIINAGLSRKIIAEYLGYCRDIHETNYKMMREFAYEYAEMYSAVPLCVKALDHNFGIINSDGTWLIEPKETKQNYRKFFSSNEFHDFSKLSAFKDSLCVVNDYCEIGMEIDVVRQFLTLPVLYNVNYSFIQAAPGTSKTTHIIRNARSIMGDEKVDTIIVNTCEGRDDISESMSMQKKIVLEHFQILSGIDETYKCCQKVLVRRKASGWSNLYKHIQVHHSATNNLNFGTTKKSHSIFRWIEWVCVGMKPFAFVEDPLTRINI
ncbi:hypothetical protein A3Q56_07606, partial [Intoshia linei]